MRYKSEIHAGEHAAIIEPAVWQQVQSLLQRNGRAGGTTARGRSGALLLGLLRCAPCGCAMVPSGTRKGSRKYCYYVCTQAQKRGWHTCPSRSIPAGEVERFVIERLRSIGHDPGLLRQTIEAVTSQVNDERAGLDTEQHQLLAELKCWNDEVSSLISTLANRPQVERDLRRLADLQERIRHGEQRSAQIRERLQVLEREQIQEADVEAALAAFDPLWAALTPAEQTRIIRLLVAGIDYDGSREVVTIRFEPTGIRTLASERKVAHQEKRA